MAKKTNENTKSVSEAVEEVVEVVEERVASDGWALIDYARKVFHASLGLAVVAQEEVGNFVGDTENRVNKLFEDTEGFINKLIEKGAIAEKDGRNLISELSEKRKQQIEETSQKVSKMDERIERFMNRMNIPTRRDMDELSTKIGSLSRKVDQLKKATKDAAEAQTRNGVAV
jgi:poly(hydroxyalkanoate) granule-associated protein